MINQVIKEHLKTLKKVTDALNTIIQCPKDGCDKCV